MATNPMQRRSRNSFMLGMLLMFVISAVIIGFLAIQLLNKTKQESVEKKTMRNVCVLNTDVKSGQEITSDMIKKIQVSTSLIPSNAWGNIDMLENYSLRDKEGNEITTESGNNQDETRLVLNKNGRRTEVKKEENTTNYYIGDGDNKEYIELDSVPIVAKVSMNANTILTAELISKADSIIQDDVRREEYNVVILPVDLSTGDYIDIRLMVNGQNYIVVSKKEVEIPIVNGVESADTMWANLSEGEILYMSDAILTAASVPGAKLYAVKYTEPGMQAAAMPTYVVNEGTRDLIRNNPNILEQAKETIRRRLEENQDLRTNINNAINAEGSAQENQQSTMEESMKNSLTTRREYWDALATEATTGEQNN